MVVYTKEGWVISVLLMLLTLELGCVTDSIVYMSRVKWVVFSVQCCDVRYSVAYYGVMVVPWVFHFRCLSFILL